MPRREAYSCCSVFRSDSSSQLLLAMPSSAPTLGTVPQTVSLQPISKEHTMKPLSITLVITTVLIFASCHSQKEIVAAKPVNQNCRCTVEKAYYENPIQPAPGGKMPAIYGAPGNAICPCGIDNSDQGQARAGYGTPAEDCQIEDADLHLSNKRLLTMKCRPLI